MPLNVERHVLSVLLREDAPTVKPDVALRNENYTLPVIDAHWPVIIINITFEAIPFQWFLHAITRRALDHNGRIILDQQVGKSLLIWFSNDLPVVQKVSICNVRILTQNLLDLA